MATDDFSRLPSTAKPSLKRRRDDRLPPLQSQETGSGMPKDASEADHRVDEVDSWEEMLGASPDDAPSQDSLSTSAPLALGSDLKERGMDVTATSHAKSVVPAFALVLTIVFPSGFGAIPALVLAVIALFLNHASKKRTEGFLLALMALTIAVFELGTAAYFSTQANDMGDNSLQVATTFLENFGRYEEGEEYSDAARRLMSVSLRNTLKPPQDERLSFDIADKFGRLNKLTCNNRKLFYQSNTFLMAPFTLPSPPEPQRAILACHADYAVPGPPVQANFHLLSEEGAWKIQRFDVTSPMRGVRFDSHSTPSHLTYGGR